MKLLFDLFLGFLVRNLSNCENMRTILARWVPELFKLYYNVTLYSSVEISDGVIVMACKSELDSKT